MVSLFSHSCQNCRGRYALEIGYPPDQESPRCAPYHWDWGGFFIVVLIQAVQAITPKPSLCLKVLPPVPRHSGVVAPTRQFTVCTELVRGDGFPLQGIFDSCRTWLWQSVTRFQTPGSGRPPINHQETRPWFCNLSRWSNLARNLAAISFSFFKLAKRWRSYCFSEMI